MKRLKRLFNSQKSRAKERGIAWHLTFDEWLELWGGRIAERGRRRDQLCMARFGDEGPYAVGNVKIVTNAENVRERKWTEDQRRSASANSRQQFSDPARRESLSQAVKAMWQEPEYRAKVTAIHRDPQRRLETSKRVKRQMADPARRKLASEAVKRRMANPVERAKQAERVRAYWRRYREAKARGVQ